MNIFVTDKCPILCAKALDDKRLIKMVLETAQLLSSSIFLYSQVPNQNIYKPTHMKHPCTIWASETKSNWEWLLEHLIGLSDEYSFRYNKIHKTSNLIPYLKELKFHIKDGPLTKFANCTRSEVMNIDFRNMEDVHLAYKIYLSHKWKMDKLKPKWTNSLKPDWYINHS
jgi:hypothetical protein